MESKKKKTFILEELADGSDVSEGDNDSEDEGESDKCIGGDIHELDRQIEVAHKGFKINFSEDSSKYLYDVAGSEESEVISDMEVVPNPLSMSPDDEELIVKAKRDLKIPFEN